MSVVPFLAFDISPEQVWAPWRSINPSLLGGFLVVGAIGLVTGLVLVWAIFIRKRGRRRRSHHHSHRHAAAPIEAQATPSGEAAAASPEKHRRWRRSRRRHRSRNPTLAETGGLPPVRPEGPVEPQV